MGRVIRFDRDSVLPVFDAVVRGPRRGARVRLVFDTGAAMTQLSTPFVELIGCSATTASEVATVVGPAGDVQWGYTTVLGSLSAFGVRVHDLPVGVFDFDNFSHHGIDGLLGYDVIKSLHLEFDGPGAVVRVL